MTDANTALSKPAKKLAMVGERRRLEAEVVSGSGLRTDENVMLHD